MALDLEQPQSDAEQARKGRGDAPVVEGAARTAAEEHGLGRAQGGFTMEETFAEYRALRASVMRFYVAERSLPDGSEVQDVIRFNEAIDQALAESITEYAQAVDRYRDMFLAVLGHDLRSPLNAILSSATMLADYSQLSPRDHRLATTIAHTATNMTQLVDDLLDYTSQELGHGIELRRTRCDLVEIAADVVREAEMGHPDREFRLAAPGQVMGEWDRGRLRQVLSNLVTNAARHAQDGTPITVSITGDESEDAVVAAVHNAGAPIPEDERELIFQPFRRSRRGGQSQSASGRRLGLGLYIARRMAEAHGGTVEVVSSAEAGTTFCMRVARGAPEGSSPTDLT